MKQVEYKRVDLVSVFWLFGGIFIVVGFIIALFGGGILGLKSQDAVKSIPLIGPLLTGFVGTLVFAFVSGVIGGAIFTLVATIYNIFATFFGGIKFDVKEKD